MANEKLLQLLQQGRGAFVKWRTKHPKAILDLMDAELPDVDLRSTNLRRADLIGVNLSGANLSSAVLAGADLTRSKLAGINLHKAELGGALMSFADLTGADLTGANLRGADLSKAGLEGAILKDARLDGARLNEANLKEADLSGASLRRTDLSGGQLIGSKLCAADFSEALLTAARLDEADLTDAHLNRAMVKAAQFHRATFGWTGLGNLDLSGALGLETITHAAPSSLGCDTIARSKGKLPEEFQRVCGVGQPPDSDEPPNRPPVCFLSFSEQDRPVAELLQKALAAAGLNCWLHAKPMEQTDDLPSLFDRRPDLWDKLLLCASTNSLKSWWIDDELTAALGREEALSKQSGKEVELLVPMIVDGYIQGGNWRSKHTQRVYDRLNIDFSRCRRDKERFAAELNKVIRRVRGEDAEPGKKRGK